MALGGGNGKRREVPLVRIFLSSPGDVAEERKQARELIDSELPKIPSLHGRVALQVIAWDDPAARIPMMATETPQDSVNASRPRPATCDIVIVILWSRMGTPLPGTVRKPDGEPYLSGTEWEYEDAVNSPLRPPPIVLVYRRTEEPMIGARDPNKLEKLEQVERVDEFFERFCNADGSLKGGVNEYPTENDFKPLLRQHLAEILHRRFHPYAGDAEAPATSADIPSEYLEWLKRTCADVSLLGQDTQESHAVTLNHVYVPALTQRAPDRQVPRANNRHEGEEPTDREPIPLLRRLNDESLYVPAAAGAGKSTFCRWAALRSISGAAVTHPVPAPEEFAEPEPVDLHGRLPLLVPLRDFVAAMDCGRGGRTWRRTDLEGALAAWVDASPPPGLSGDRLKAHLGAGTVFLLLDGLDEVLSSDTRGDKTVYPRELLLSGLADALPDWQTRGNRILLTSRPYGLDEAGLHRLGLPSAPLEPLPKPLQELFVTRWFHTLGKNDLTSGLIETIRGRDDLAPLVENPMLLTALCVLHESGGHLPEDRYELYRRIVNNVLLNRFPGDIRERDPVKARLEAIAFGMHTGDAESPRANPAPEISHLEIERLLRDFAKEDWSYERQRVEPAARREELLTRSGLLLPRPNQRASFYHLSFQEFLAAERILRTDDNLEPVFREHGTVPEWRPTLMFLFAGKIASKTPLWGADLLVRLMADQDRAAVKANPAPAVFISEALELCLAKGYRVSEELADGFRRLSLDAIKDEIEIHARHALGLCLGSLGDPRIVDLRDPGAYVEVPAGTYPYGEEGETVEIETPFRIGRYPVTNSQYQAFMDDGGDQSRQWWSETGWKWLQREQLTEPAYWRHRRWNGPNQPVVGVRLWEAEACCAWAGGRLPGEQEWEAAARGPDGFVYPWGNDWEDGICNSGEAGLGTTSSVGLFPRSRQRTLDVEDLAGNVLEWCDRLEEESDAREGPNALRVLRGGSWGSNPWFVRSADRGRGNPDDRYLNVGFRVARTF